MRKNVLKIAFFIALILPPYLANSQEVKRPKTQEAEQQSAVALSVEGNIIRVQNVSTKTPLEVYNILGVKITSMIIDSPDKTVVLNLPKGCYIVKIQDVVRKIAIK